MLIGTILLDEENNYVDKYGNLPVRPSFDKQLLATLCTNAMLSPAGYDLLPPSIRELVKGKNSHFQTVAITIPELNKADVLIVSRSPKVLQDGKKFRLDNFIQFGEGNPQIYIKNKSIS